jgi:salicylate hydroxylase
MLSRVRRNDDQHRGLCANRSRLCGILVRFGRPVRACDRDWDDRVAQTIAALSETYVWGIYDRPALPHWTSGHTILIGDAAHPMVPHLGQGAGQAIEDAYTLGVLLKGASKDTLAERLTRYERLRRDHTARVQTVARQAGQFYRTEFLDPGERDATMGTWMKEVRWILEHDADAAAVSELERSRT